MVTVKNDEIPPTTYTQTAREMFRTIREQRWRLVAILVYQKKTISIASNDLVKTHPYTHNFFEHRKRHAEFRCLQKAAPSKVEGSTMYVWRFTKNGSLALAKPCEMCTGIMHEKGVKRVIYSIGIDEFGKMRL